MDEHSRETLRMIEQNDVSLTGLCLGPGRQILNFHNFNSSDAKDFSRLGAAIGANTHITTLLVNLPLTVANGGFYDGVQRNTSINELGLVGGDVVESGHDILKVYQEQNNNLINIRIGGCNLENGGDGIVVTTLRQCINLCDIRLVFCDITDQQLMSIVEGIRGHCMLEVLFLEGNRIGDAGCDAIATLIEDPSCILQALRLPSNNITNEGATTIANSLTHNTKLQELCLKQNPFDMSVVQDAFSKLLCNTSSINHTYSSNHTLEAITGIERQDESNNGRLRDSHLLNAGTNKRDVAMKKILRYHPNIDMRPFFRWDSEGEQTLKALPYVLGWFDRAMAATDDEENHIIVDTRKLTAIHQFAKAMPLLIASHSPVILFDRKVRQQLETKNAELEAKNAELEAKNSELEAKIAELTLRN